MNTNRKNNYLIDKFFYNNKWNYIVIILISLILILN
jgi:hypothetical protein